jgi:catechol-2,3-dioxygenase
MNKQSEFKIAPGHGEVAVNKSRDVTLRVNNLKPMKKFYQECLGFELLAELPSAALLIVGAGSGAQSQMLGLLQRSVGGGPERNTVGHIALIMPVPDHELERKRLEALGLRVEAMNHEGIGKRLLCFRYPEGNEVELPCCDPTLAS